ncbi:MAG: acyl-CoA desaturase [Bacteroidia bacterium]|nr:acyl-CoA desaturase [Bacteroidia bacterium]
MEKPISFANLSNDFPMALKRKVDEYFRSKNIKQTGNWKLYLKTIILVSLACGCYWFIVFGNFPFWSKILVSLVFGLTQAGIGFNVMHDGAHGSYSQKPWINSIMAYTLNLQGGSVWFWKIKHNVIHHNVTNVEGHDDDVNLQPLMRTNEHQPWHKAMKYQHIYGLFLYCQTLIWWLFVRDYVKYFTRKIASKDIGRIPPSEHFVFWFTKVAYIAVYMALPIYMLGVVKFILFFLAFSFIMGFALAIVFQLAHVVETAQFPLPKNENNKIEHDWFYHQFATTANFATQNKIVSWYTGGLNYQVEHHLFPRVSHVHYPALRLIVKDLCGQYHIPYNEFPTMWSAIKSHLGLLKKLGAEEHPNIHVHPTTKNEKELVYA